jgi:hypothetical protein
MVSLIKSLITNRDLTRDHEGQEYFLTNELSPIIIQGYSN